MMSDELFDAIQAGDLETLRTLVGSEPQRAAARNAQGVSAILLARYYGRRDIAEMLEATGTPLDIFEAAAAGYGDRVRALLGGDATLASAFAPDGFTPIGLAAFFGQRDIVHLLIDHGAEVNAVSRNNTGYTALTAAVARGEFSIVQLLLDHGAHADYRYGPGYTPLHGAAAGGHLAIAQALVANGADLRAATDEGKTPRQMAEEKGHHAMAEWLQSIGG